MLGRPSSLQLRTILQYCSGYLVRNHSFCFQVLSLHSGNELNLATTDYNNLYSLVYNATLTAHDIEGANWHPVSTPTGDRSLYSIIPTYDYSVDLWALQIYRGGSFGGNLWKHLAANTTKPAVMSEFGIDAWNNKTGQLDMANQAYYDGKLFQEIVANSSLCTGGTVFQFMDGWWKAGNNSYQLTTGSNCTGAANDGVCNPAWFGIHAISLNATTGIDDLSPRTAYTTLQSLFLSTNPYP
jgi:hypothetical protein